MYCYTNSSTVRVNFSQFSISCPIHASSLIVKLIAQYWNSSASPLGIRPLLQALCLSFQKTQILSPCWSALTTRAMRYQRASNSSRVRTPVRHVHVSEAARCAAWRWGALHLTVPCGNTSRVCAVTSTVWSHRMSLQGTAQATDRGKVGWGQDNTVNPSHV